MTTDPIERPSGATQLVIQKNQYPLKVYLILVFGLVLVAVAFGGSGRWATQAMSSSPTQRSAYSVDRPIYVVMTVLTDKPVTITPTPTRTMVSWELTAAARPTNTATVYQTATPYRAPTRTPTSTATATPNRTGQDG